MFANFNYNNYEKKILLKWFFNTNIKMIMIFDNFLNSWLQLYNLQKDFIFIFDTTNVGYIPIKYSFKMSAFIKKLKK